MRSAESHIWMFGTSFARYFDHHCGVRIRRSASRGETPLATLCNQPLSGAKRTVLFDMDRSVVKRASEEDGRPFLTEPRDALLSAWFKVVIAQPVPVARRLQVCLIRMPVLPYPVPAACGRVAVGTARLVCNLVADEQLAGAVFAGVVTGLGMADARVRPGTGVWR